ncbi:MAG: CxxxxCH/CxxCH domain-containing protein, partial [bacterium]
MRTHTNTDQGNADVCGLCHAAPSATPPFGCFNNTLCHGSVAAPHPVPFTDPALHGPPAKGDLIGCQPCHANPPAGSEPQFNVPIGNL